MPLPHEPLSYGAGDAAPRRPLRRWIILLLVWIVGLAVWALYLAMIVVLLYKWLF